MWLSGFGLTIVQLLTRMGAAARAVPADAVIAATPMSAAAIERPNGIMRFSSPTNYVEVSRRGLSLLLESFPSCVHARRPRQLVLCVAERPPSAVARRAGRRAHAGVLLNRRPGPLAVTHCTADHGVTRSATCEDVLWVLALIPRVFDRDAGVAARARGMGDPAAGDPVRIRTGIEPRIGDRSGSVAAHEDVADMALRRREAGHGVARAPLEA